MVATVHRQFMRTPTKRYMLAMRTSHSGQDGQDRKRPHDNPRNGSATDAATAAATAGAVAASTVGTFHDIGLRQSQI